MAETLMLHALVVLPLSPCVDRKLQFLADVGRTCGDSLAYSCGYKFVRYVIFHAGIEINLRIYRRLSLLHDL